MGNSYEAPKVEKRKDVVTQQVAAEVKAAEVPAAPVTPATIYKNGFNDFVLFLKGEKFAGELETRQQFQLNYIDGLWAMLELPDATLKQILDHYVVTIMENHSLFEYHNVLAPLFTVEGKRASDVMDRYKRFMMFIIMYAENARNRGRFLEMYDVPKFVNMLTPTAKQRITNYIYR